MDDQRLLLVAGALAVLALVAVSVAAAVVAGESAPASPRPSTGALPFNPEGFSWIGSTQTALTLRWSNQVQNAGGTIGSLGPVLHETISRLAPPSGYVGAGACSELTQFPVVVNVTVNETIANAPTVEFYNLTGLLPGAQYCDLTITATNANGTNVNPNGAIGQISTTGYPVVPPAPSSLKVLALSGSSMTFDWIQDPVAQTWTTAGESPGVGVYEGPFPPAGEVVATGLRAGVDPSHTCSGISYTETFYVGNLTFATVGGLPSDSFFCVSIDQSNQSGTSNWSSPLGFETLAPGESESFNGSAGPSAGFLSTGLSGADVAVLAGLVAGVAIAAVWLLERRRR
ncbi:MAG: hypothetical protein L3K00_03110 [Thermoplasmata archaeon]|nr:hypothetical protein [Thermoplasmata archaeon]